MFITSKLQNTIRFNNQEHLMTEKVCYSGLNILTARIRKVNKHNFITPKKITYGLLNILFEHAITWDELLLKPQK